MRRPDDGVEAGRVEALGGHVQRVARTLGDQHGGRGAGGTLWLESATQPGDVPLQGAGDLGRGSVRPEQADQGVGGDGTAAVQREGGEQCALLAGAEVDRGPVDPGLGRAQYADPHVRKNRPATAGVAEVLPGTGSNGCSTPVYPGAMAELVAPPGWPRQVRPPGAPGWEHSAVAWLLDICPPEFRSYPVLRRHDVVLARFAVLHVEACQAAVRRGLSEARGALRDVADLAAVDAAVETWQAESARLMAERRAVGLVEEALRGRRFVARL